MIFFLLITFPLTLRLIKGAFCASVSGRRGPSLDAYLSLVR